jgi:hypothetical protein
MSLLDDARQMLGPIRVYCYYCTGSEISGHFEGCPATTVLPRLVAVVEAAEDAIESWEATRDGAPDYAEMSALRRALRGETGVTAQSVHSPT